MPDPLSLARMRACRTMPVPAEGSELAALLAATNVAGRRLIDVQGYGDGRVLMLGWPSDVDPASALSVDEEHVRHAAPSVLLTLAACIGCCWPSPDEPLFPGNAVPEEQVLGALRRFTRPNRSPDLSRNGRLSAWKGALRFLRACGLLGPDTGDSLIRLGPEVAAWGDAEIRQLMDRYDDLPGTATDAA
jgi:hypothetical protein